MKSRSDATVNNRLLVLADIIGILIAWIPGALTWATAIYFVHSVWSSPNFYFWLLLLPFLVASVMLLTIFIVRMCIPRLKPGVYEVGSLAMRAWYMHFMLVNSLHVSGLMPLIYSTYLTRWLYFRAMGARIDFGVHLSIYTKFREFPLIKIGKGSSLSAGVHIACHTHVGDKLMLGPVEIGEKCFIGMDTVIGPRTKMGEGSWIGYGNRIIMERLAPGTRLENFEWVHGNPARLKGNAKENSAAAEE